MALFRDVFGAERRAAASPKRPEVPTAQVAQLRRQGLTNDQIIQTLQREGFTLDSINNAINMVDARESVAPFTIGDNRGTMQEPFGYPQGPSPGPLLGPMGPMPGQAPEEFSASQEEKLQEIAEAIIDEKWNDLVQNVAKVVEWKTSVEAKLNKLEQEMKDLKENFQQLHTGVLQRLGDYDKNIKEVGTEIKALEKVFEKILPGFVENVQELSRVAQTMRRVVPPKK